jgi:hypothetical protein
VRHVVSSFFTTTSPHVFLNLSALLNVVHLVMVVNHMLESIIASTLIYNTTLEPLWPLQVLQERISSRCSPVGFPPIRMLKNKPLSNACPQCPVILSPRSKNNAKLENRQNIQNILMKLRDVRSSTGPALELHTVGSSMCHHCPIVYDLCAV